MSRNSSGTYTLPSGNPVVSGTLIEASWANTTLDDLASAMTDSLSRSGQGGMTAALRLYDGTSSVPGLAWGSETTTGWYRAGAGDMRLVVTGSEVMKYLSTGVTITGTLGVTGALTGVTDITASGNGSFGGTLAVTGASTFSGQTNTFENSTAYYPQLINRNKTADANGSYISLQKIRGSSIVQNGDVLGNVIFAGYDGSSYLQGAYINAVVSATPGTNDMPTDLAFGTTPDGSAGPSERFRFGSAGQFGIGGANYGTSGQVLQSNGPSAAPSWASVSSQWTTSGSNIYYNTGNVGIGTASPGAKLDVSSTTWVRGGQKVTGYFSPLAGDGYNLAFVTSGTTGYIQSYNGTATNALSIDGSSISFRTGTFTTAATIDSSGNVGIGTSSPVASLTLGNAKNMAWPNASGLFSSTAGTALFKYSDNSFYFDNFDGNIIFRRASYTESMRIESSGQMWTTNGAGSVAKAYDCRAWVNFNGTGTVAIRASGNVTSITDNGTGDYTVNFTTAMPDANYSVVGNSRNSTTRANVVIPSFSTATPLLTGSARINSISLSSVLEDPDIASISIFR